jgi:poly(A) polymerase
MNLFKDYPQLKVIQKLAERRRVQIYLVGGFLRDIVLNRARMDFDFAVEKNAVAFAESFAKEVKGAFILLDEEHGCARVAKKTPDEIMTFDFADFRAPTIEEDLAHRDFTINTLSLDLSKADDATVLKDAIVDVKRGLKDIKEQRIKRTSARVFQEDPLRMLRAFSLKAVLDFKIELTTLNQIRREAELIRTVSYERIRDELFKILESGRGAAVLKSMHKTGLLEKIVPHIRVMYDCKQGGYHHLDVWPHSLETVVQMEKVFEQFQEDRDISDYISEKLAGDRSRKALMKLACLLHDIGKPDTRKKEGERISFHGHENVGRDIVRHIANMLILSTKERHALEDMVQMHLRPGYLSNFKKPSERMIFRYFRDAKAEALSILLLSMADQRATRGPLTSETDQQHHAHICRTLIEMWIARQKEEPFVPLINGHDVMKNLKLKPSPLIGKILDHVEELQALGKVRTKAEALKEAQRAADNDTGGKKQEAG